MFVYTALGDSITAGDNATSPWRAYPSMVVAAKRQQNAAASGCVLAQPGWTSGALSGAVLEAGVGAIARSSVVSVWVGGDDIALAGLALLRGASPSTVAQAVASYGRNLEALTALIGRMNKNAQLILCTQYNPFPHTQLAGEGIAALNEMTMTVAARHKATLAPAHEWFAGRQAEWVDGYRTGRMEDAVKSPRLPIHPNDAGHAAIARGLEKLMVR